MTKKPSTNLARTCLFFCCLSTLCTGLLSDPIDVAADEPPVSDTSQDEIDQFRKWLVDAWNQPNVDKILAQVHPNVVVTWQDGTVSHGHDEVRKYIASKTDGPDSILEKVTANPTVDGRIIQGDYVFSWGQMNDVFVLRKDHKPLPFNSRFSAVLHRDYGRLLLTGIHFSVNVFENPVQDLAVSMNRLYALIFGEISGGLTVLLIIYGLKRKKSK